MSQRPPSPSKHSGQSPSKYISQATDSPTKLNVPSKTNRNQASNRVHDIDLATEISTSLLSQVRGLQAVLAERDETIKTANLEKARLEDETAGLTQRVRNLDESEQRYKDENWSLEMQTHEMLAAAKEAADREQRLNQSLSAANAEKVAAQKEIDDLRQTSAKFSEDHDAAQKHHEAELSALRRTITLSDNERGALKRKVDELVAQNQELATAFAGRSRQEESSQNRDDASENEEQIVDHTTPENSPPPSPLKGTPRHSMLESETLKSSLSHAHRMIQNLKGNIHREKTEKADLKRLLQDARDELELRRSDSALGVANNVGKRKKMGPPQDVFKKPARPGLLGVGRTRSEILLDEAGWEDNASEENSPSRTAAAKSGKVSQRLDTQVDTDNAGLDDTANEGSDAFETANEREDSAGEKEDIRAGAENLGGGSSDEHTETESGLARRITMRSRKSIDGSMIKVGQRTSFASTASNSGGEEDRNELGTPTQAPQQRFRLKVSRGGANRRARLVSEASMLSSANSTAKNSPASFASNNSPAVRGDQSLFAELGDMNGQESDEDGSLQGTPSRAGTLSQLSTPGPQSASARKSPGYFPPVAPPRPQMVDSGIMTEAWEPQSDPIAPLSPSVITASPQAVLVDTGIMTEPWEPQSGPVNSQPVVTAPPNAVLVDSGIMTEPWEPQYDAITSSSQPVTKEPSDVLLESNPVVAKDNKAERGPSPNLSQATPLPSPVNRNAPGNQVGSEKQIASEAQAGAIGTSPTSPATNQPTEKFLGRIPAFEPLFPMASLEMSPVQTQHIAPVEPPMESEVPSSQISTVLSQHTEPDHSERGNQTSSLQPLPQPPSPPTSLSPSLMLSTILTQATQPIEAPLSPPSRHPMRSHATAASPSVKATDPFHEPIEKEGAAEPAKPPTSLAPGFFGSVFGWNKSQAPLQSEVREAQPEPVLATKETQQAAEKGVRIPFKDISANAPQRGHTPSETPTTIIKAPRAEVLDQSSQTALSADQIDHLMNDKGKGSAVSPFDDGQKLLPGSPTKPSSTGQMIPPALRPIKSQDSIGNLRQARAKLGESFFARDEPVKSDPPKPPRRGSSSGSLRRLSGVGGLPPLPPDHKQAIAAAAQRSSTASQVPGVMGPPVVPASAYKTSPQYRPRTPSTHSPTRESSRGGTTPRPRLSTARSDVSIPLTRRSSVTSFASELDERFNIRSDAMPFAHGFEGGTDPRMIQAITQTMIGEYLWKYTRKAGRGEMSDNRHRRFFWVHPYTRTLYWSDRDPATAGRAELKAKSVAIEAVRVITDDNPMPPGLHRKSLVIITPGRAVKFTATTGQRHETWFNALSYLLLRTNTETTGGNGPSGYGEAITEEDVDEFNPGSNRYSRRDSRRSAAPSMVSLNSHASRTMTPGRHESPHRHAPPTLSSRPAVASGIQTPTPEQSREGQHSSGHQHKGSISRISNLFKPATIRGSFSSRRSRHSVKDTNVYQSSAAHDSANDLRQVIERQERDTDRLENVRACCDGKSLSYPIIKPSKSAY